MFSTALMLKSNSFISQVKPYNIAVSVVFPPDTDTPGFENENKNKVIYSSSYYHRDKMKLWSEVRPMTGANAQDTCSFSI